MNPAKGASPRTRSQQAPFRRRRSLPFCRLPDLVRIMPAPFSEFAAYAQNMSFRIGFALLLAQFFMRARGCRMWQVRRRRLVYWWRVGWNRRPGRGCRHHWRRPVRIHPALRLAPARPLRQFLAFHTEAFFIQACSLLNGHSSADPWPYPPHRLPGQRSVFPAPDSIRGHLLCYATPARLAP